jgi:peptide/nickel transport system substrate-binding protein
VRQVRSKRWSWMALLAAFALVVAACPDDDPAPPDDDDDVAAPPTAPGGTFEAGVFDDMTTDNFWTRYDTQREVWNAYVLDRTVCALYGSEPPNWVYIPNLADAGFEPAQQDGDVWFVEVSIRDAQWSDGEQITAHDFAFTWDVVNEFGLAQSWIDSFRPNDPVTDVIAVDDQTVRIEFNRDVGLPIWPTTIGTSPWMPEHFWAEHIDAAREAGEAARADAEPDEEEEQTQEEAEQAAFQSAAKEHLYALSGQGAPSCGAFVFESREPGAFARSVANENYHLAGRTVTHYEDGSVQVEDDVISETFGGDGTGDVVSEYTVGPHVDNVVYTLYGTQEAGVLGLRAAEIDYLFNPLGLERGLQEPVLADPNLESVVNPAYGIRYMAFNFSRAPMDDPAFRLGLSIRIDREFMAESVLGGVAFPLFTTMPPGNAAWYDEEIGDQLKEPFVAYANECERIEAAVQALEEGGYSWSTRPEATCGEDTGAVEELTRGEGMTMPDGSPMPEMSVLTPSAGYDPLRATYGVWIERWAQELGIPLRAELTGFSAIVAAVFGAEIPGDWDMYILGWSLGSPAMPTFHESFFHTTGASNVLGFSNADYDDAAERFMAATTAEEAYEIMWNELEPIIAEELPYVNLFDTPILEAYHRDQVTFPYTDVLGGLQLPDAVPHLVQTAQ